MVFPGQGVNLGSAFGRIEIDVGDIDRNLDSAEQRMNLFQRNMMSLGQGLMAVGQNLSLAVTAPLSAVVGLASRAAIEYESAFAGVKKVIDESTLGVGESFETLSNRLMEMASDQERAVAGVAGAHTELARIMQLAGQLGVEGADNLERFTETIGELTLATNLTADAAAMQLARFANIVQMPIENVDRLGSVIVELGNNMATMETDIVAMALRLSGAGNIIGLTEAEIMALAATLSSVGIAAQAGGTALSRVMINIDSQVSTSGDKLETFAQIAQMSAEEFAAAWQEAPADALVALIQGLGELERAGVDTLTIWDALEDAAFTEIRVRDALLRTAGAGDLLARAMGLARDEWEANNALQEEVQRRFQTTEAQMNLLKNTINGLLITLGEMFLPIINQVVGALVGFVNRVASAIREFKQANPELAAFAAQLAAVAMAVGPLLIILGKLITVVAGLASGPVALAAAGLTTLAWAIRANFAGIGHVVEGVMLVIDQFLSLLSNVLPGVAGPLRSILREVGRVLGIEIEVDTSQIDELNTKLDASAERAAGLKGGTQALYDDVAGMVADAAELEDTLSPQLRNIVDIIKKYFNIDLSAAAEIAQPVLNVIGEIGSLIQDAIQTIFDPQPMYQGPEEFRDIAETLGPERFQLAMEAMPGFISGVTDLYNTVKDFFFAKPSGAAEAGTVLADLSEKMRRAEIDAQIAKSRADELYQRVVELVSQAQELEREADAGGPGVSEEVAQGMRDRAQRLREEADVLLAEAEAFFAQYRAAATNVEAYRLQIEALLDDAETFYGIAKENLEKARADMEAAEQAAQGKSRVEAEAILSAAQENLRRAEEEFALASEFRGKVLDEYDAIQTDIANRGAEDDFLDIPHAKIAIPEPEIDTSDWWRDRTLADVIEEHIGLDSEFLQTIGGLWDTLSGFWDTSIGPVVSKMGEAISGFFEDLGDGEKTVAQAIKDNFGLDVSFVEALAEETWGVVTLVWENHIRPFLDEAGEKVGAFITSVTSGEMTVGEALLEHFGIDVSGIETAWETFWTVTWGEHIRPWLEEAGEKLLGFLSDLGEGGTVKDALIEHFGIDVTGLEEAWEALKNLFEQTISTVIDNLHEAVAKLEEMDDVDLENLAIGLGLVVGAIALPLVAPILLSVGAALAVIAGAIATINGFLSALPDIVSFLEDLGAFASDAAAGDWDSAIENLGNALNNLWNAIQNFLLGGAQGLADALGLDIDVEAGLAEWQKFFDGLRILISSFGMEIGRVFGELGANIELAVLQGVRGALEAIGDLVHFLGFGHVFEDIDRRIAELVVKTDAGYQAGEQIANNILAGMGSGEDIAGNLSLFMDGITGAFSEHGALAAVAFYNRVADWEPGDDVLNTMKGVVTQLLGTDLLTVIETEGAAAGQAYLNALAEQGVSPDIIRALLDSAQAFGGEDGARLELPVGIEPLPPEPISEEEARAIAAQWGQSMSGPLVDEIVSILESDLSDEEKQQRIKNAVLDLIVSGAYVDLADLPERLRAGGVENNPGAVIIEGILEGIKQGYAEKGADFWSERVSEWISDAYQVLEAHSPSRKFMPVGGSVIEGIMQGVTEKGPAFNANFQTLINAAINVVTAAETVAKFYSAGASMIDGLISGLTSKSDGLAGALTGMVNDAVNAINQTLGIASPSRVFAGIGEQIGEGLAAGIMQTYPMVRRALLGVLPSEEEAAAAVSSLSNVHNETHFTFAPQYGGRRSEEDARQDFIFAQVLMGAL